MMGTSITIANTSQENQRNSLLVVGKSVLLVYDTLLTESFKLVGFQGNIRIHFMAKESMLEEQ